MWMVFESNIYETNTKTWRVLSVYPRSTESESSMKYSNTNLEYIYKCNTNLLDRINFIGS